VVSSSDPVFARLEHHKSHEYSSRRTPGSGGGGGAPRKRRGRPPKTVNAGEDEIGARAGGPSSPAAAHGFARCTPADRCPDERRCAHPGRGEHLHRVLERCHDVETDRAALVVHDRELHSPGGGGVLDTHDLRSPGGAVVAGRELHLPDGVPDGFEFFGADVDCRRAR